MRIAIVVHGRFHAFDLAREMIRLGQDVCVVTNYPKRVAARFGIAPNCVRNNLFHGVVSRVAYKIDSWTNRRSFEPLMHRWFSGWAARVVMDQTLDVIHGFSGVCEEFFKATEDKRTLRTLVRGSAHVDEQFTILADEEERSQTHIEKPSQWIRGREKREYQLADYIFVLSRYAYKSFVARGVSAAKLRLLPLGAELAKFRPTNAISAKRSDRIRRGDPLRVLSVGSFSLQKGALDYVKIARVMNGECRFRFVGTIVKDAISLQRQAGTDIEFLPRVPQNQLPRHYEWGDIFLYPTLQDGYAVVLAQAQAAGLPLIATTNCAAPDLLAAGQTGWVFPIRRPDLFIERLRWCDQNRHELAAMVEATYNLYAPRDWSDVAQDFIDICVQAREETNQREVNVARA
jgi:glycosyltransferase involved in cell wall biosynthesis